MDIDDNVMNNDTQETAELTESVKKQYKKNKNKKDKTNRKNAFLGNTVTKVVTFFIAMIFLTTALVGISGVAFKNANEYQYKSPLELTIEEFSTDSNMMAYSLMRNFFEIPVVLDEHETQNAVIQSAEELLNRYTKNYNTGLKIEIPEYEFSKETKNLSSFINKHENFYEYNIYQFMRSNSDLSDEKIKELVKDIGVSLDAEVIFTISLNTDLTANDTYQHFFNHSTSISDAWIFPYFAVGGSLLFVVAMIFLCFMVGRRKGERTPQIAFFRLIPWEILLLVAVSCIFFSTGLMNYVYTYYGASELLCILLLVGLSGLTVLSLAGISQKVKTNTLYKYSLIYFALKPILWILRELCKLIKNIFVGLFAVVRNLDVLWQIIFIFAVLMLLGVFMGAIGMVILWGVIVMLSALYFALAFNRIYKGTEDLKNGNFKRSVKTDNLVLKFKDTAENINTVKESVSVAVEEKIKSEILKTQLITNVSHDLKTPLTSIINYADLISKEESANEKITEYAEILTRQSNRLKNLINDLVEASKASSGNVEINLEKIDISMLVTQIVAEYADKMAEKNMQVVNKIAENSFAEVDPRQTSRIFDNVFSNAYKYGMNGTRVFVSSEQCQDKVCVKIKNTSAYQLEDDIDGLLERFSRADKSRSSEGHGLGLSIAQSLAEVQGGELKLSVDGDIFCVEISFKHNDK